MKDLLTSMMDRIDAIELPPWGWSAMLFVVGLGSLLASVVFYPSEDPQWTMILGRQFGGECGMQVALGIPCPSCGMTRSWIWLVRGEWLRSLSYNAAGTLLFCWLVIGGVLGGARLLTRNYELWKVPFDVLFWWTMFWLVVPYTGLWLLRILGYYPL